MIAVTIQLGRRFPSWWNEPTTSRKLCLSPFLVPLLLKSPNHIVFFGSPISWYLHLSLRIVDPFMDQAQDWRRLCIRNAGRSHHFDTAIIPPSIFLKRSYGSTRVCNLLLTVLDSQRNFFVPSCCVANFSVRKKWLLGVKTWNMVNLKVFNTFSLCTLV